MSAETPPKITVLMPVFNAGAFLAPAVQSILSQTFTDFELLLLNDGSTDDSLDTIASLADPRIRLVHNPENLGLIATLNRGLEMARAPLVARMDADDLALPARLERQFRTFAENSGLALLGTAATTIDEFGQTFGAMDVLVRREEIIKSILRQNAFIHPSVMMRVSVARAMGGYPVEAHHAEDYALWLKIASRYPVANLPERLMQYRVHPGQVSQRKLVAQRKTVQRLQRAALEDYVRSGLVHSDFKLPDAGIWAALRAKPGSVGADYLFWARTYRAMGRRRNAVKTAMRGLANSPLSGALIEVCLPAALQPTYWRACLARTSKRRTTSS